MIGLGTLVNTGAIVVGGTLGTLVLPAVPEQMRRTIMQAIGLTVIVIGLHMVWPSRETFVLLISMVLGAVLGELAHLEDRMTGAAGLLERVFGKQRSGFARSLVEVTLIFCVGAMSITGALDDGLTGDHTLLYVKSILDGVSAIMFASTMGLGVLFAAIPVFVYQGAITLGATWLHQILAPPTIAGMTEAGGLLIAAIGYNLTGLGSVKVANLLPAILVMAVLLALRPWMPWLP